MSSVAERLNEIEESIMSELKDFQQATVERIDYLYKKGQNRILISDEVGLGKTLIARGTIAKFAKLRLDEGDDLVKVVYMCSNATIVDQNMEKLRLVNEIRVESGQTSRLSMQHLNIFKQENDKSILDGFIQLIPLTPNTSFKIHNSEGIVQERALIFAILTQFDPYKDLQEGLGKILQFEVGDSRWEDEKESYLQHVKKCNEDSNGAYFEYMGNEIKKLDEVFYEEEKSLKDSLIELCRSNYDKNEYKKHIVKLRIFFADVSLNKLDPDLIILDEFQRFKSLLNEGTEINRLTTKFFNSENARILMLSATPYKLYSTLDEMDIKHVNQHYNEFFDLIKFLNKENFDNFETIWKDYSFKLKEINKHRNSFLIVKSGAEKELYSYICRTERISESLLTNIIDDKTNLNFLSVSKNDIESYRQVQRLLDDINLNRNVPIDYIKSSPYIMSFMENYKLKESIEGHFKAHPDEVWKMDKPTFWLKEEDIENYNKIQYNNARLENLMGYVLKDNVEKLLWVPPSKPYYELKGPFKNQQEFSKTLIFSSWEMVPRMVSSMVSYEIERKTIGKTNKEIKYSLKESIKRRMPFEKNSSKQTVFFAVIYPSIFLKEAYNPIDCLNRHLSLDDIEIEIKEKIKNTLIEELNNFSYEKSSQKDDRWYYLAPLLLDNSLSENFTDSWFEEMEQLNDDIYYDKKGYLTRFADFARQYRMHCKKHEGFVKKSVLDSPNYKKLGGIPDDLYDVLCDIAIASPAICAYRTYEKLSDAHSQKIDFKDITKLARNFIRMMDRPYTIPVIELSYGSNSKDDYWKHVLKYSKEGNLQAVFDEYGYLLANGINKNNENKMHIINDKIIENLNFGATPYEFDSFDNFKLRINGVKRNKKTVSSHFGVSFIKGKGDDAGHDRKKSVRNVFNSPFRPFVLTSTSIGQEGLDFHNYCRRIVHWNLPSNPIDLEQREGRINRFESLAIRQNVAKRYGKIDFRSLNIWEEMFDEAYKKEKSNSVSDLIPYWGLKETADMVKIERVVPMYPFSRDVARYNRLVEILNLYRLSLGQANQDYLMDLLGDLDSEDINELFINLSPYYSIFKEFHKYGLPIESEFCKLTCNNPEKFIKNNVNYNLSDFDYYEHISKLSDKINESNLFKKPLIRINKYNFGIPLRDLMWNLVHINMFVRKGYVGVGIGSSNSFKNENLYKFLLNKKEFFEEEFGMELFFNIYDDSQWEISIFSPIDIKKYSGDAVNWQICMSKRFDEIFFDEIFEYYKNNPLKSSDDLINRYWIELFKKLHNTNLVGIDIPQSEQEYNILWSNASFSQYDISLYCNPDSKLIGIIIKINQEDFYEYLLKNKLLIENQLGLKLKWADNKSQIIINYDIDINNKTLWFKAIDWHLKTAQQFKNIFHSRIGEFYRNI